MSTPLPYSPFVDVARVDPDNRFVLDETALFEAMRADSDVWPYGDWPVWSTRHDPPPPFISDPSSDYMDSLGRELAPILHACRRR